MKSVWSASLPLTPYRGVLNRLSIAHCKALGESCLLSHKSSSWGVVGRSYGRQKKMANGTMKMVKASLKVTGSLRADTRTVYLIKRYFIVFLSPKIKPCDPTWTWKTVLK